MKLPELPKSWKTFAEWCGLLSGVAALVGLLISLFSQSGFVTEYEDMDRVPLRAIQKGFGSPANPLGNGTQLQLLRVSVINNKTSVGANDVKIVVDNYIEALSFVVEENGDAIQKYSLTPSANTSRLEIPIGHLPPRSEHVVFVGCKCLYIDFADVHAESSNLGISASSQAGELSGFRLFIGTYAPWVVIIFLAILGAVLLARRKTRQ